jgi:hypothetical protein
LKRLCKKYELVFWVAGNHEFKGSTIAYRLQAMRHFAADPGIKGRLIVLENDRFDMIKYGYNVSILGCTLWTCVRQNQNAHDSASIIGNSTAEYNRRFQETFAWLKEEVQVIRKEDPKRRILIITHYAPTLAKSSYPS